MIEERCFCDICGQEIKEEDWGVYVYPLELSIFVSSRNPLGIICGNFQNATIRFQDVCEKCRTEVAGIIADWILTKKKDKI